MTTTAQKTVNGRAYRLVKLPPLEAGRVAIRVGQALAGAFSDAELMKPLMQLFEKAQQTKPGADEGTPGSAVADMLKNDTAIMSALAGGVKKLDTDTLYSAAEQCVKGNLFASEKLTPEAFDRHFGDFPGDLLPVMTWALQENCAGFFALRATASKPGANDGQR